jgi:xylulokinase
MPGRSLDSGDWRRGVDRLEGASAWVNLKDVITPRPEHADVYHQGYPRFRQLYEACRPLTRQETP